MSNFQEERERIAVNLAKVQKEEARLVTEVARATADLTRVRARIASLRAEDQTYSAAAGSRPAVTSSGDLSRMTIREAILIVLAEAKPDSVPLSDLDRMLTDRGKKVAGGPSVDLTILKQAGEVLNPRRGYWTVP